MRHMKPRRALPESSSRTPSTSTYQPAFLLGSDSGTPRRTDVTTEDLAGSSANSAVTIDETPELTPQPDDPAPVPDQQPGIDDNDADSNEAVPGTAARSTNDPDPVSTPTADDNPGEQGTDPSDDPPMDDDPPGDDPIDEDVETDASASSTGDRVSVEPPVTETVDQDHDDQVDNTADAAGPSPVKRRRTKWLVPLIAVVIVALLAALTVFVWLPARTSRAEEAQLLMPEELVGLKEGSTWKIATTTRVVSDLSPQPMCLVTASTSTRSKSSTLRTYLNNVDDRANVIHQIDRYATATDAATSYADRLLAFGNCSTAGTYLVDTYAITGLGDEAVAIVISTGNDTSARLTYHTIVMNRTGTIVNVTQARQDDTAPSVDVLAQALGLSTTRECSAGNGACPTLPATVAESAPPVADHSGWLVPADLPQVSIGIGEWQPGQPTPVVDQSYTQCENVAFSTVTEGGAPERNTYELIGDPRKPDLFGIDAVMMTFGTPEAAASFAGTLNASIAGCNTRDPNTTIVPVMAPTGFSAAGVPFTGFAYGVTKKGVGDHVYYYRTAIVAVDNRVMYLFTSNTADFNFTDPAWSAVAGRAGERMSQRT